MAMKPGGVICQCALLTLLSIGAVAAPRSCPGPNKVPQRDGTYDFTYESWIRKYPDRDHWDFGRCVENKLTTLEMYVDWEKTGVKGWAKPQDKVDTTVDSLSPDYDLIPTDLWYGSAPTRIDTKYRETKVARGVSPDTVNSRVHMAVPSDPKHASATLISIEVRFMSEVSGGPDGYRYRYTWTDLLAKERAPVRFRSEGLSKLLSAAEVRQPERLDLTAEESGVSFVSKAPPAYAVTLVEFLDKEGETVVGTAPVAMYHPENVNVPIVLDNDRKQ
jgi:hypothetical protein